MSTYRTVGGENLTPPRIRGVVISQEQIGPPARGQRSYVFKCTPVVVEGAQRGAHAVVVADEKWHCGHRVGQAALDAPVPTRGC
jgi:hypothetical protein